MARRELSVRSGGGITALTEGMPDGVGRDCRVPGKNKTKGIVRKGKNDEKQNDFVCLAAALVVGMVTMVAVASQDETGNGAPSGHHFALNIIGVKNVKNVNMDQGTGNVIFVPLGRAHRDGHIKFILIEGEDFAVLDKNGTDLMAADFKLIDPGLDPYVVGDPADADTLVDYSVFVRPLGPQADRVRSLLVPTCSTASVRCYPARCREQS